MFAPRRLQENPANFEVPFPLQPADLSTLGTRVRAVGGDSADLLQRVKEADAVNSALPLPLPLPLPLASCAVHAAAAVCCGSARAGSVPLAPLVTSVEWRCACSLPLPQLPM